MAPVKRNASEFLDAKDASTNKRALVVSDDVDDKIVNEVAESDQDSETDTENDGDEMEMKDKPRRGGDLISQDIQIARETAELFKSNIFKLQIDELLQQLRLKDAHILRVEKFLHKLYDVIQEVPEWTEHTLEEVQGFFKGKVVSIPFCEPKPSSSTQYKFNYKTPDVSLIGSFALKSAIYQPWGSKVDVLLTMPGELFEKKDFLNFRCLHKRSVYLAYLTHHLVLAFKKNSLDFLHLEYSYFNGDTLQPILNISCEVPNSSEYNFYKTKFSINLIVGFPYGVFESKKLLPNNNCIRVDKDSKIPTPFYNFSILSATTHEHYLKYLYTTKKQTESFKEACILGRLWLNQRGFHSNSSHSSSLGGFGHFQFSTLMAALLNGGGVNGNKVLLHGFSSYQLFKGTIKYLATMDLSSDGYLEFYSEIDSSATVATSKYVNEGFQTPTIFDKTTKINILSNLSVNNYEILKLYAQETLMMLSDVVRDQFENIFLTKLDGFQNIKYDLCYDMELPTAKELLARFGPLERASFISFEVFLHNKITNVTKLALGDRIKAVDVELVGQKKRFPISKRKPAAKINFTSVRIKLLTNPIECEKLVTKGPAKSEEESSEAIEFKNFWGRKASLRRFKNGSIMHCCVWSTSSSEPVITSILEFAYKRHLSEDAELSDKVTKKFHDLLPLPNVPGASKLSVLNMSSFYNVKKSFDALYAHLFKLKLPLNIKSILPVGSAFRYTTLCQPVPFAYSNPDFLQEVIIEFESSTKWPDELSALEKAKTAFLLKIQDQLSATHGEQYKFYFSRDESIPYNLDIVTLNILTPEGYGFKFRVLTERDEVMYLRAINTARSELKPALEEAFLTFTAKYQASIRHTRTIEVISHSLPFYSPVVRLFKRWLDSHLLIGHLSEEFIELIAIKPFVDAAPFCIPGSVENGFLKILRFLSEWNWREDPLILDLVKPEEFNDLTENGSGSSDLDANTLKKLSEKLTLQQYKAIQNNFSLLRKNDPQGLNLQFFVASKNDPRGILYSSAIPLPIATRLTALAKVAVNLTQLHGLNSQTIDLLFTPALRDYDFVFTLKSPKSLKLSSGVQSLDGFRNLDEQINEFPKDLTLLSEKMDSTYQLVKYLNMKYKNSIIFSSHRYIGVSGGPNGDVNVITGLIKPWLKKPLKFKVNMDCNVKPIDKEMVELNKDAIFHEIAAFGKELVLSFETNQDVASNN
ncbi:HDL022Cp [Eremothecium sinecaudum]|uniref:U3 small nucleolar RNA-associated protein 22 n=1 Tax=Eremothecium sinecaudum TaxID=45286 RepID=A0A0X8HSJ5_9SACH|nr:HDL022Cp [Eremothecium sinecaudum]AMD20722.1 HDL022Cp [Eremothecium sinecaudum]